MAWSWWALPGLIGVAFAFAVAAFTYFSRPDRAQNRWLGLFIFLEALYILVTVPAKSLPSEAAFRGTLPLNAMLGAAPVGPYLMFLATLDTPLVRPFRHAAGKFLAAAYTVFATLAWWIWPHHYYYEVKREGPFWIAESGTLEYTLNGAIPLAAFTYGFVVALSAWRRAAPGTAARLRARAYAIAFGFRDASFAVVIGITIGMGLAGRALGGHFWVVLGPLVQFVYLATLVYGIAKTQLFDIDLKLKWTLRRGTVAGLLVAVFLVAVQVTEQFLQQYGVLVGGVSVGLLLFFLRPLQSVADRLADRAMPDVQRTPAYVAFRKLEVYKAAVEELAVGGLTPKERRALEALRAKLQIPGPDALRVEGDVQDALRRARPA